MIRFCSSGTVAAPISTPRSPRATITASASSEHLVERLDRLRLLDLRDHAGGRAVLADDRLQVAHVGGRAHERERDEVDAETERELEVVEVLLRERRDRHRHAGQVDALVRLHLAADDDPTAGAPLLDLLHGEPDEAVVDQDVVARPQHLADHGRRDRQLAVQPMLLADDDDLLVLQQDARLVELADAELRALEVGDQRERLPGLLLDLAHDGRARRVVFVRAVREVEADRVDARLDELAHSLVASTTPGRSSRRSSFAGAPLPCSPQRSDQ